MAFTPVQVGYPAAVWSEVLITHPGRFFAANVVKIALAHLLMEYDWSLGDDAGGGTELETESIRLIDPEMRVSFKKISSIHLPV